MFLLSCSPDCITPKESWDNSPVGGTLQQLYGHEDDFESEEENQYNSDEEIEDSSGDERSSMGCMKLKHLILPENLYRNIGNEITVLGEKI